LPKRVTIVGGGISGLATAYYLERTSDAEITLFEASDRLGGKLQTVCVDRLTIEEGPDCFFARKEGAYELALELGLDDQLIGPAARDFSMLIDGRLHRIPSGLLSFTSPDPEAVAKAEFLSELGKKQVLAEREAPKGNGEDESIASFFRRRFGEEFSMLVAEPLLAGTHAGDPEALSLRALYPAYYELERKRGSLYALPSPTEHQRPNFVSLKGGMHTLVQALRSKLTKTKVVVNEELRSLEGADAYVLAMPAPAAAQILDEKCPDASERLRRIEHASSTIVTLAFKRTDVGAMTGTGFLVPQLEGAAITGCTWTSLKWPSRAPSGTALIRVFMGYSAGQSDEDAITQAVAAIKPLAELRGDPKLARVRRWIDALPQYHVGHLELLMDIDRAVPPGIHLTGTSYRGVGIPDCVRQAKETAARVVDQL
jgi:protoporphyrinogen/coproporphyrinogen III oxidase